MKHSILLTILLVLVACMPTTLPADFTLTFESTACGGNVGVNTFTLNHAGELVVVKKGFGLSRETYKANQEKVLAVYQDAWKNNLLTNRTTEYGEVLCGGMIIQANNKIYHTVLQGKDDAALLSVIAKLTAITRSEPIKREQPQS